MNKNFDDRNSEKKIIDNKITNSNLFFHEREIWWCSAGLNIGVESNGKHDNFERPIVIIKKFNSEMIWILPLTTQAKNNPYYYKLEYESIKSYVVLSQLKTISTKRLLRKTGSVSLSDFQKIKENLKNML